MNGHNFYSMVLRMKYVDRWGLMRSTWKENLSVHSLDVAVLAHALAVIGKKRFDKTYDVQRVPLLAMFHDTSEIITGDLPTPVKYHNPTIVKAYKQVEREAGERLLSMLPGEFRGEYESLFTPAEEDRELWLLVKAADKLSALIKCIDEENAGNREFLVAKRAQLESLHAMNCPEAEIFLAEFLDGFTKTLDEQQEFQEENS